jgi:hypothetical protein
MTSLEEEVEITDVVDYSHITEGWDYGSKALANLRELVTDMDEEEFARNYPAIIMICKHYVDHCVKNCPLMDLDLDAYLIYATQCGLMSDLIIMKHPITLEQERELPNRKRTRDCI